MNEWNEDFFKKRHHIAWRAKPICDAIMSQYRPRSVVDIGCSIGEFVKEFLDRGIDTHGIEVTKDVLPYILFPKSNIHFMDIRYYHMPPIDKADLALCFMVVGRLDKQYWDAISANLAQYSDTVITVVEEMNLWSFHMGMEGYMEKKDKAEAIKQKLEPWKDKTAIRSFWNCLQVFKKED